MTQIKFGTDGWRAIIAEDFTYENLRIVIHAIARYVARAEQPGASVVIGYDARFGGERFARVAAETISAAGTPVLLADADCPTPAVSLLVKQRGAAAGIQISASHNPSRWNGVKLKARYGSSASGAIVALVEAELAKVLRDGVPSLPPRSELIEPLDVRTPYLETLAGLVDWERLRASKFRYVFDPMHGSGRGLLRELFHRQGIEVAEIRGTRDPLFDGVNPEPIEPNIDALRIAIREHRYDAGFVADGDADRIGAMDCDGTFVTPHQIFAILLWHLAGTRKLPGEVVKTFSTTKLVDKIAAKFGRTVRETPIGFKFVCDRMLEGDVLIGGEESGGIGTKLYLPERDATVNALLLAEVMAWHGQRLGELVAMLSTEFGDFHYGRLDLELGPGQKERAIEHFADDTFNQLLEYPIVRRENLDGIKVYLGETGWLLVRASGTERMLRIYCETASAKTTQRVLEAAASLVRKL